MRIAVLGAGYAGITLARNLERRLDGGSELIVVNDHPEHLIRHELHRTIRRPDLLEDLRIPIGELLDDAEVLIDRVESINPDVGRSVLKEAGELEYDYAAVCLGSKPAFYGLPGVETHATPFRDPVDADRVRTDFLERLEAGGTVAVGGAGLTGIQVAGELAELAADRGRRDSVEIQLLEQRNDVAPGFDDQFRAAIRDALEGQAIDVRTGVTVTGADDGEVRTEAGSIPVDQFVWTGGIGGGEALDDDRPSVPPTLRLSGGTFALGDAARVIDRDGDIVPASAQAAIAEARVAATNLARLIDGPDDGGFEPRLERLAFSPTAWIVSVGDDAVASLGPTVLRGRAALALKTSAGVGYLSRVGQLRRVADLVRAEFGGAVG